MHLFKLNSNPPPLEKMDKEERKTVLMKFTKANLKLNISLEPYQVVELFDFFIDSTLNQIDVTFNDWKGLKELVENFSSSDLRHQNHQNPFDLQKYVQVKMRHQNAFCCFLFFLERKFQQTVSVILFQLIADRIAGFAKTWLSNASSLQEESLKKSCLTQLQLVTLFILLNEYSEFNFKRVVKLSDTLKVSLGKLSSFSTI